MLYRVKLRRIGSNLRRQVIIKSKQLNMKIQKRSNRKKRQFKINSNNRRSKKSQQSKQKMIGILKRIKLQAVTLRFHLKLQGKIIILNLSQLFTKHNRISVFDQVQPQVREVILPLLMSVMVGSLRVSLKKPTTYSKDNQRPVSTIML